MNRCSTSNSAISITNSEITIEHLPELQLEIKNNPGYAQAYLYLGDIALHTNDDATAEPLLREGNSVAK